MVCALHNIWRSITNSLNFTVAITRAQALLIIVGNPVVLSLDPLWRALLNYIHEGGGWRGKGIGWDPKEPILPDGYDRQIRNHAEREALDMISRLKSLIVENTEDLGTATDSDDEGYMDNGVWREEE
jgi:helicase MOV-10